jgi:DNA-binding Xre family transcriptional regulator
VILSDAFAASEFTSQTALGKVAGISQSQLSKHLRGERPLTIDELDALCMALHLSIVDVVRRADYASPDRHRAR